MADLAALAKAGAAGSHFRPVSRERLPPTVGAEHLATAFRGVLPHRSAESAGVDQIVTESGQRIGAHARVTEVLLGAASAVDLA